MKKIVLFAVAALVLLTSTTSCIKEVVEKRYVTEQNNYYGSILNSYEFTIRSTDWITSATTPYYYATTQFPEINKDIEDNGVVVAYVWDQERWNLLPYVYPYYSESENATWGENLRFDWCAGEVTFILQNLDGGKPEGMANYPDIVVRVCIFHN